jgi:translation initiation factor 1
MVTYSYLQTIPKDIAHVYVVTPRVDHDFRPSDSTVAINIASSSYFQKYIEAKRCRWHAFHMNIDLRNFDMSPEWNQSPPSSKLPPKKAKKQKQQPKPKSDGVVRVGRETKGRKGAGVTIITGIPTHPEGLKKIAKELKQKCGTGGTVKNGVIEIQGDQRDRLVKELTSRGYTVKKSGG